MLNHLVLFFVAIGIGIVGAIIGWELSTVIILIVALTLLNISYYLYIILASQNIKKIEKVIQTNKKDPMYAYLIALKNENIDEVIEQIDKLTQKYKQPKYVNSYALIKEILTNNYDRARELATEIKDTEIGQYSLALVGAYTGNGDKYLHTNFNKPWMNDAIKATHYFAIGEKDLYEKHRDLAIATSKGIQLASNIYTFNISEKYYEFGKYNKNEENS